VDDHGGWPAILNIVGDGKDLTREQASAAMASVLAGEATNAQLGGLILALRVKGESVDEMEGLATGMLEAAEPLDLPADAIDIVGTGGSAYRRKSALNVSTMASFLCAAAGATVCKHGNYKASSTSGSFDLLSALGVQVELSGTQLPACVAETGLGFALARSFHPAMRHAGPVRAELGVPTVFNVLGPLAHPGQLGRQVLGTAAPELAERMAHVRHRMGSVNTWVVAGADSLDELSTSGENHVWVATPEGVEHRSVVASDVGVPMIQSLDELGGGDARANLDIFHAMAAGAQSPARDIVVLNAAAGLVVSGTTETLEAGVQAATDAIDDGRLADKIAQVAGWRTPDV